jgi:hypothetical protein
MENKVESVVDIYDENLDISEFSEMDSEDLLINADDNYDGLEDYSGPRGKVLVSDSVKEKQVALMARGKREALLARQQRKVDIKREYVSSGKSYLLTEPVSDEDLTAIIEYLTAETQKKCDTLIRVFTAKVEKALRKLIPGELKSCFTKYPQAFIQHPGFIYQCAEFYGGYKLWVQVNIPYYFQQFSEMDVLQTTDIYNTYELDRLVEKYFVLREKIARDEINMAIRFDSIRSLEDLMDLNLKYYDAYVAVREENQA